MKYLMIIFLLCGCSAVETVADKGAKLNDEGVKAAIYGLCYGFTVGSIKREFNTADLIKIYNDLCKSKGEFELLEK